MIKGLLALVVLPTGGYMIFDGLHRLITGSFFGPGLGPWATVLRAVGIDPLSMGLPFVILGALWILFFVLVLNDSSWGFYGGSALAAFTLWYLPIGTAFSVAYLIILFKYRTNLLSSRQKEHG